MERYYGKNYRLFPSKYPLARKNTRLSASSALFGFIMELSSLLNANLCTFGALEHQKD